MSALKYGKIIQAVYDSHGGTRQSAKLCGYSAELLSSWKRQGRVPLNKVAEISRALRCAPIELNKVEVTALLRAVNDF